MRGDIKSQIDRAKKLLEQLEECCKNDLSAQSVSEQTKNLTQEVLLKMRHVLDQAMHDFFEKHIAPNLSEREKSRARVYFPVVSKKEDLKSVLGRSGMASLETDYPDFFAFLDSVQPYNADFMWLKHLSDFAAEKHIGLTPQVKKETRRMTASIGGSSVSVPINNPNVTIRQDPNCQVSIGGIPVKLSNNGITPLAPGLNREIATWVTFKLGDSDINAVWLCRTAVTEGEKLVSGTYVFI